MDNKNGLTEHASSGTTVNQGLKKLATTGNRKQSLQIHQQKRNTTNNGVASCSALVITPSHKSQAAKAAMDAYGQPLPELNYLLKTSGNQKKLRFQIRKNSYQSSLNLQ